MMRWLYTGFFIAALPFILLRLWWRGRGNAAYRRRWRERFGFVRSPSQKQGIWLHAVSVGEAMAAIPLIEALLQRYPGRIITVTTTTPTGSDRIQAAFSDRVHHVYAPYDLPWSVRRFLRRVQPSLCLIMETELWPNTLAECARAQVKTVLVNARLSKRSARGYRKVKRLTQAMLHNLSFVAAQQEADRRRLVRVGLPAERCQVTGSIKSDVATTLVQQQQGQALRKQLGAERFIVIAASTHEQEDEIILSAFVRLHNEIANAVLILVPRHPERFEAVYELSKLTGLTTRRRSANDAAEDCAILLGDTMGELMSLYAAADVAFIGGSLVPRGGHNLLEAAAWGLPIIQGPYTHNFAIISKQFRRAGALCVVHSDVELLQVWRELAEPSVREQYRHKTLAVLAAQRGALARVIEIIDKQLMK